MELQAIILENGNGMAAAAVRDCIKRGTSDPTVQSCHNGTLNVTFPVEIDVRGCDFAAGGCGMVRVAITNADRSETVKGFLMVPQCTGHTDPRFAELMLPTRRWAKRPHGTHVYVEFEEALDHLNTAMPRLVIDRASKCVRERLFLLRGKEDGRN